MVDLLPNAIGQWVSRVLRGEENNLFRRRAPEQRTRTHQDAQALSFYGDVSNYLTEHLPDRTYSLFDIGPRTGAGLALLRLLHHPDTFASVKLDPVLGTDIDPIFLQLARSAYPDITAHHGDALSVAGQFGKWDIVMSSHTVEHLDDPEAFLMMKRRLAKEAAVVCCPFEEELPLHPEHRSRIDLDLLSRCGYAKPRIYRSSHWFKSLCILAVADPLS